mmetsp:Transcript_80100/g.180719  ORF Transcript_80100/g.180719 Transcript_80100/m.180719 type:complete len:227 (-) Transcript_80100:268-948(-)
MGDHREAERKVQALDIFFRQLREQQPLQTGAPRAGVRSHSDGAVSDHYLSLAVHERACPQVDEHFPGLGRAKVKLRVVPVPAILEFLLLDVGPRRALPEVVKDGLDAVHPLLAAVHLAVLHEGQPLGCLGPAVDAAALRRQDHGQVTDDRIQRLPGLVCRDDHRGADAGGDRLQALPQLHRDGDHFWAPAGVQPQPLPCRNEALQEVYDDEPLGGVRPLLQQLLVR